MKQEPVATGHEHAVRHARIRVNLEVAVGREAFREADENVRSAVVSSDAVGVQVLVRRALGVLEPLGFGPVEEILGG